MRILLNILICLFLLSSCSPQAQLVTLRGNNVKPTNEGLVLDNDTLTLRYQFYSERGNMHITVVNKLNVPLYVDWKRSSFIVGQNKFDYWYDVANVDLTSTTSFGFLYSRYAVGSITGTISREDQVAFIPPKTKVEKQQFVVLPNGALPTRGTPQVKKEKASWDPARRKPVSINLYAYSEDQSPLTFRNYLTLSTDKDFKNEFYIDTEFWASDMQMMPMNQLTGGPYINSDGMYITTSLHPYRKPNAFYITIPQ